MSDDRLRQLELQAVRLEERLARLSDDLRSMSQRLWGMVALVLFYVINQLLGLLTIGGG